MQSDDHYRCPICKPTQPLQKTNGFHECAKEPEDHKFVLQVAEGIQGLVLVKPKTDEQFPAVRLVDFVDAKVLLGRIDASGQNQYYEKITEGGVPYFGAKGAAVRFSGYDDPELVKVKAATPFETFYEEA